MHIAGLTTLETFFFISNVIAALWTESFLHLFFPMERSGRTAASCQKPQNQDLSFLAWRWAVGDAGWRPGRADKTETGGLNLPCSALLKAWPPVGSDGCQLNHGGQPAWSLSAEQTLTGPTTRFHWWNSAALKHFHCSLSTCVCALHHCHHCV